MTGAVTVPRRLQRQKLRLADLTPAEMAEIYRSGHARELLSIGDLTGLVPISGRIGDTIYGGQKVRFRLVHIDSMGLILMLATNARDEEIGLWDGYANAVPANNPCICMNRKGQIGNETPDSTLSAAAKATGPNKHGWQGSYCRRTIMPQIESALPQEWRDALFPRYVWSNNTGGVVLGDRDGTAGIMVYLTHTYDKIFNPDTWEILGTASRNQHPDAGAVQEQWEWFRMGNRIPPLSPFNPGAGVITIPRVFMRSAFFADDSQFESIDVTAKVTSSSFTGAAFSNVLKPCISIA